MTTDKIIQHFTKNCTCKDFYSKISENDSSSWIMFCGGIDNTIYFKCNRINVKTIIDLCNQVLFNYLIEFDIVDQKTLTFNITIK